MPTDTNTLAFGSAERSIDLSVVDPDFSTNVPAVFIASELGGMGQKDCWVSSSLAQEQLALL
jgi:hypothetical protein